MLLCCEYVETKSTKTSTGNIRLLLRIYELNEKLSGNNSSQEVHIGYDTQMYLTNVCVQCNGNTQIHVDKRVRYTVG